MYATISRSLQRRTEHSDLPKKDGLTERLDRCYKGIMKAITYNNAKKNLRALIREVCKNAEPTIIVNNESDEQAVLISLEDYQNMEETAYLLRSPANRAHLEKSLRNIQEGNLVDFPVEDL